MSDITGVVCLADMHLGSTLALCLPSVQLDDGGTYRATSKTQRTLWSKWQAFLNDVKHFTADCDRVVLKLVGDIMEFDSKARSWQLVSRNPATLQNMARELLDPLVQMSDILFVYRGTEAHSGKSAHAEEELAQDFGAEPDDKTGRASWWHFKGKFSGVTFDVSHHPEVGFSKIERNAAAAVMRLAYDIQYLYLKNGEKPPDLGIRAHYHQLWDSGRNFRTRAITLPCWTSKTSFNYRLGLQNHLPDIGGVIFKCQNKDYEVIKIRSPWKQSRPWTMAKGKSLQNRRSLAS